MIFRVIDLPAEVDLSKVKATLDGDTLEVVMPKADPAKSVRVETKSELPVEDESAVRKNGGIEAAGHPPVVREPPSLPSTRNSHRPGDSVGRTEKRRSKNVIDNVS
jgi:hypothetical protein